MKNPPASAALIDEMCMLCREFVGCLGECPGMTPRTRMPDCFRRVENRPGDCDPVTGDWLDIDMHRPPHPLAAGPRGERERLPGGVSTRPDQAVDLPELSCHDHHEPDYTPEVTA